jgi:hypothetical protein
LTALEIQCQAPFLNMTWRDGAGTRLQSITDGHPRQSRAMALVGVHQGPRSPATRFTILTDQDTTIQVSCSTDTADPTPRECPITTHQPNADRVKTTKADGVVREWDTSTVERCRLSLLVEASK